MPFVLVPIVLLGWIWAAPAAAQSALTKPNNDASLRRTQGVGGPPIYRGGRARSHRHDRPQQPDSSQPKD